MMKQLVMLKDGTGLSLMYNIMFNITVHTEDWSYVHQYHRPFETEGDWNLFKLYIQGLGYRVKCNHVSRLKEGRDYNEWI